MNKDKKQKKPVKDLSNIHIDVPDDEIWTYRIDGLAEPHINKPWKNFNLKVFTFVSLILIAIGLSMFFSFLAVIDTNTAFEYVQLKDGSTQFSKFSNNGYITDLTIDYVSQVVKDKTNRDPATNFTIEKDESKPITSIKEFTFNCDEKVEIIRIGKDVKEIDAKSFYTCRALKQIIVDEENPNYCDIDGVLYNKDKTEIICFPMNRGALLRERHGYNDVIWPDNDGNDNFKADNYDFFSSYKADCMTYVVPATVKKIGKLAFSEAHIASIYLPEGLEEIGNLGFFRCGRLEDIFSYESSTAGDETGSAAIDKLEGIYYSLPEGLKSIGTDAMSYNRECQYLRIPSSVEFVGHNAFWDTCKKEKDGSFSGYKELYFGGTEEEFAKLAKDTSWQPRYAGFLDIDKKVETIYGSEKKYRDTVLTDKEDGSKELTVYYNNEKAKELKLDESLGGKITSIGNTAFKWDNFIEELYVGKDVEALEVRALYNLRGLKKFTVDKDNKNFCDIDGVLYSKDKATLICYPAKYEGKTYIVPSTVTKIERSAFMNCKLETIYFPESLKTIGDQAFLLARDLKDIYSYKGENEVTDESAIENLKDVYVSLPEGLEYIGLDGFNYASSLTYMYIPSSIQAMCNYAFCYNVYIDEDGEKQGLTEINVALSQDAFTSTKKGGEREQDHWIPEYRNELGEIATVNYSAERK